MAFRSRCLRAARCNSSRRWTPEPNGTPARHCCAALRRRRWRKCPGGTPPCRSTRIPRPRAGTEPCNPSVGSQLLPARAPPRGTALKRQAYIPPHDRKRLRIDLVCFHHFPDDGVGQDIVESGFAMTPAQQISHARMLLSAAFVESEGGENGVPHLITL